jgi:hypothetical protein
LSYRQARIFADDHSNDIAASGGGFRFENQSQTDSKKQQIIEMNNAG